VRIDRYASKLVSLVVSPRKKAAYSLHFLRLACFTLNQNKSKVIAVDLISHRRRRRIPGIRSNGRL